MSDVDRVGESGQAERQDRRAAGPGDPSDAVTSDAKLRRLAIRGSLLEMVGYGANMVLRLVSSLVLSRLLFPEAYGLTAIVGVYLYGMWMLSDMGVRDCVMRSQRGDDVRYLNTAWTLHVVRGLGLFCIATALAWPISWLYGKPILAELLAVSAITMLAQSFESTALFTLARHVRRGPIVIIEVVSKIAALVIMITWARLSPTVWALVAGSVVSSIMTSVMSHLIRVGYSNRFAWDREALKELKDFGKWVLGSSGLTFIAQEGDRLLLGYLMPLAAMGVYSIASMLSTSFGLVIQRLTGAVVYGVLTTAARERPHDLGRLYYAARLRLDLLAQPVLGMVAMLAPVITGILYDERYAEAGWMLEVLSIRVALSSVHYPASSCLVARGEPKQAMLANAARALVTWAGVPVSYYLYGVRGAIWALVASELAVLLALNLALHRRGILRIRRELIPVVLFGLGLGVGWVLRTTTGPLAADVIEWSHSLRK